MLRTAEYSYTIYPYILHKQQLAPASGLQKRFCIWHFVFNTVQGFSSSHPFPVSHLLTGLPQSIFSTCLELFLLQGYQDNNYTSNLRDTNTDFPIIQRSCSQKLLAPISCSFYSTNSLLHCSTCYSPFNFKYSKLNYPTHRVF